MRWQTGNEGGTKWTNEREGDKSRRVKTTEMGDKGGGGHRTRGQEMRSEGREAGEEYEDQGTKDEGREPQGKGKRS
jgi:hypothetical protein